MKKFTLFILSLFLVSNQGIFSQSYTMANGGSISSCSGTFLDPGGTGNYSGGSSDWTYTICNPTAGQPIYLSFTSFNLWSNSCVWGASVDELFIYNGPSTASPLIGTYSDNTASPSNITGASGCLTFRFHRENLGGFGCSSNSGDPGWSATISCTPPPPPPGLCSLAQPFCTSLGVNFPASVGTTSEIGPNYGCLLSQPSPAWYYLNIATSGNIMINLSNSSSQDIDFAIWGPFATQAAMCAGTTAAPIDCSFSTAANETVDIPNAIAGQWYIMVITNFANTPTNINAVAGNAAGVDGTTNCNILCNMTSLTAVPGPCVSPANTYSVTGQIGFQYPPSSGTLTVSSSCGGSVTIPSPWTNPINYTLPGLTANGAACSITATFSADPTCTLTQNYTAPAACTVLPCYISNLTANIGSCLANNTFIVNGTFTYENNPGTGTAIVTVTNSSGSYTQTFNPAFVNGQTYNYSISGIPSDGSPLTVTVAFSSDPACTLSVNSTSPADCNCAAEIGTFTASITGVSANNYVLCYGDEIDITANGNYTPPAPANNPPNPGGYEPGITWLVYSCPPSVALTPNLTTDIPDDPCLIGMYSDFDMYDINDQFWMNAYPAGTFTNNTVYFVPITMYNLTGNLYSYVNTSLPCYELGAPYAIQYLPQIITTTSQNCTNVTVTVSGGLPAVNGSQFTAVAGSLTPANASFANTTATNGGTIAISGLTSGQAYSFQVQDANGCPVTITGTFVGPPVLTYPQVAYCKDATNPSPTVTGAAGGTYSSTAGLSINASTGVINIAASTVGTYVVTYTTPAVPGPVCSGTFTITINPLPVIAVPDQAVCAGTAVTLSGNGADTYTWTGGITNGVAFTPAATATYTVTGTITATGCVNTDPATVTVNPLPIVNAGIDQTVCAGVSVTLSGSGASTYTWDNSVTNGVAFTPVSTTTYTVTGTSVAGCTGTDQVLVTVNPIPVVNAGLDVSICTGGSTTLTATGATTYSWSPGGQTTASITVNPLVTSNYTVTGTSLGCSSSDAVTVTVLGNAPINAGPDVAICVGVSSTLQATGGVTYSWDNGLGIGNNFSVSPNTTTSYTVIGTDLNGCTGTDAITITLNPLPTPSITGATTYCSGNFSVLSTNTPFTTYNWSTGETTATINATQVNNPFTVTVTNSFGCQATSAQFNVTENSVITTNATFTICQGESYLIHGVNETVAGTYSQTFILPTGCDSVSNITLVVNPLPNVNAGIDQAVCIGTSVTLTATGASTYTWSPVITNGTPFSPGVGTTTYTVTGTSVEGCENTDQVDVTVNPLPVVVAGQDQFICAGEPVTLSGSGANTYTWNNGITNGVAFTPASTATYTVTGTSVAGCVNTDQVIVTVNPIPTVFAGNDVVICEGQTVTLTGSGANTYTWDNGVTNGVAFTPSAGSINYTVTGTTAAGCTNTDQVLVTVNPIPVVTFLPDVTMGCAPLTVNFTNTTANSTNCIWTISNGAVLTGCGTVATTFTQPGCYDVTMTTTSNGCTGSFTAVNIVCVEGDPVASFTASNSIANEFEPIVEFDNTSTGASNYIWYFGDNSSTSTIENPTHDYTGSEFGNHLVTLIAYSPFGCSDTAYLTIQMQEELIFYVPNTFTPDNDKYNPVFKPIFTAGFDPLNYTLLIFNRWGEVIFESHNTEIGWDGSYGSNREVNMVQDGTYTWKIEFKTTANDERKMVVGHVNVIR